LIFQFRNLVGNRRWSYAHLLGSTGKAQMSGCRIKGAQGAKTWKMFNHGQTLSIFNECLKIDTELVVFPLNRNALCDDHQRDLTKVKKS
jgi:hypothetical protein